MMAIHSVSAVSSQPDSVSPSQRKTVPGDFSAALTAARKTSPDTPQDRHTYTVRPGDSLFRIAGRLRNTLNLPQSVTSLVREMTALNYLPNPDLIFPGQIIQLPAVTAEPVSQNPAVAPSTSPPVISTLHASPEATPKLSDGKNPTPDFPIFTQQDNVILPVAIPVSLFNAVTMPAPDTISKTLFYKPPLTDSALSETPPATPHYQAKAPPLQDLPTQIAMYKEDQLLAHPGGDYYFLNRATDIHDISFDQSNFANRLGKDLADAGGNLMNIAKNLALGAQYRYVSESGEIKSGRRLGLLGTLKNFFEDTFSGLSFGAYVPEGEKAPDGVFPSIGHFFKKVFYEAPIRDLLIGIPHAAVNIAKDTALAALNLIEVIPDATVGNFGWGQKATTTVFDNGQVVVDYLTDVLPGGNAWLRVHAAGPRGDIEPPVYFNLMTAEQGITDSRWTSVRNTPFRKTIETIGSLLSDAAIIAVTAHSYSPSSDQRHD